ncbi:MAG: radical SAM family heme chaperone HemW [Sphaerochaeta sp.]|nr:radical SAM family heme chaperone HemW [Sphaerochaeta sp.]
MSGLGSDHRFGSRPGFPLALYIHIPFCTTCCSYCAFYSEEEASWLPYREAYMQRLLIELETIVSSSDSGFSSIFIGGGNPGCLTYAQLKSMLSLAQSKGKSDECTIEMNPETFSRSLFPLFEDSLVSRISIGIQSMDDTVLATLGRNACRADNLKAITLAREAHETYGVELSFDLMLCLPGQTMQMAIADIDEIMGLAQPSHISLYCLTVEEGTDLSEQVSAGVLPVLDEDGQEAFLWGVWAHLKKLGFRHYEVSNFSRNNCQCKHNLTYWNLDSYVGLGSSAVSAIRSGPGLLHISQNQTLYAYAKGVPFSGYSEENLTISEHLEEFLMMALRTDMGIDKTLFLLRFSQLFDKFFSTVIESLDSSWYFSTEQSFSLSEIGFMVLDEVVLRFALAVL